MAITRIRTLTVTLGLTAALLATPNAFATEPEFQLQGNVLTLPSPITFNAGGAELEPQSEPALDYIRRYLAARPAVTLMRIEGHTNSQGSDTHNQALSEQRALAVARWLVAKDVDCHRLIPVGFGETKPMAPNDTPDGAAKNRRIELVNTALRGRAIGGMPTDGGGKVAGDPCAQ